MEHIIIIGGGGAGAALAHDLTLRGFEVSLFEKGELTSGTTGRHHGLLHSGARYAVHDRAAAVECIEENRILRTIAPQALEQNDGLFVALSQDDEEYGETLLDACRTSGIKAKKISAAEARALEPALTPEVRGALQVPDATMDAWRLAMYFFATARRSGATFHPFCEVQGIDTRAGRVTGVEIIDYTAGKTRTVKGDLVVNAAGAWAGRVAALAGIDVPIQPGPGVLVAVEGRVTNMVINRMHPAGEGDIIVPQRGLSILGTSLWLADDPEDISPPKEHVDRITALCARMVPAVGEAAVRSVWSAARPLIRDAEASSPQQISRTFECYDHKVIHGVEGIVSLLGGKATTVRAMAEKTAGLICHKTGHEIPCRTRTTPLIPWRCFFSDAPRGGLPRSAP
ncbi:MAG: FAD-dependent oxidoreductase [Spirochaetes bacterium]|nr:FAD-dependent oxidoreductase [Spirochaetota bacterium]